MTKNRLVFSFVLAVLVSGSTPAVAGIITFNLNNTVAVNGDTSTGKYNALSIYTQPGGFGVAFLIPPVPLSLPRGGAGTFFNTALTGWSTANPGWSFSPAASDLGQNTLSINADQVGGGFPNYLNGSPAVGIAGTASTSGFAVSYTGAAIANAHWIQAVSTSAPAAGQTSPYVDNNASTTSPYYDVQYHANATTFLDAPFRTATRSNYWLGDLFYASGAAAAGTAADPTKVTIYNGMVWGWADIWVPSGNLAAFISAVNTDFTSVANLDGALGADLTGLLNQSQVIQLDSEFDAAVVPEPSTWLLLLAGISIFAFGLGVASAWR